MKPQASPMISTATSPEMARTPLPTPKTTGSKMWTELLWRSMFMIFREEGQQKHCEARLPPYTITI